MEPVRLQAEGSRPGWDLESGQGMVEYAMILIIVSVVAIVLIVSLGSQLNNMFSNVIAVLGR
jgi:pilus assembly protein Flp/PilA